jgi:hypothetical protein
MITVNLELKGKETREINFPNKYTDLTYKQFIHINKILMNDDTDNKTKDRLMLSYFLNIDVELVTKMYVDTYNELINELNFLNGTIPTTNKVDILTINNEKYYMRDLNKLTIGDREYFEMITEQHGMFESYKYLVGLLFTKQGEEDKDITMDDINTIASYVEDMSFVQIYSVFFSLNPFQKISTKNIQIFLEKEMKQLEKFVKDQTSRKK